MNEVWHAERATGIGGSDAASVLGLSPWKSPLQVYQDKTGEAEPQPESEPMRFGTLLEPVIRSEYVRRTGRQVIFGQPSICHPDYPWMRANLDGITDDRIFEAKTARDDRGWGEAGSDDVPQHYLLQVMHYMVVTGRHLADIAVLIGGSDFRIYSVPFNRDLADLIIEGERQFWDAVQRREPPAPGTLAEINLRYQKSRPAAVELPPNVAAACERLREIKDAEKEAQKEADACESIVKMEMGEADTATVDGVVVVTWKQAKSSRIFDSKAFRAAHPDVAEKYMVENAGSRRFLLKG
jgi:putative phage-type endonuclease